MTSKQTPAAKTFTDRGYDWGWGRHNQKVLKALSPKQRAKLDQAYAECESTLKAYIEALKAKGALELKLGLIVGKRQPKSK